MRFPVKMIALAVVTFGVSVVASAQSAPSTPSAPPAAPASTTPVADSTPAGPSIAASSVAYHPAASTDSLALEPQRRQRQGFGTAGAMMIAGGAAVIVGLVIGDDVGTLIAVGGAVIGLYGLYMYLK